MKLKSFLLYTGLVFGGAVTCMGIGAVGGWYARSVWDDRQAYNQISQDIKEVDSSDGEFKGKFKLKDDYRIHIYSRADKRFNNTLETRIDSYTTTKDENEVVNGVDIIARTRKGVTYIISGFKIKADKKNTNIENPLANIK